MKSYLKNLLGTLAIVLVTCALLGLGIQIYLFWPTK